MVYKEKKEITLSIDTAMTNGSFSLWENQEVIDSYIIPNDQGGCESILPTIKTLLIKNNLKLKDIVKIVYTNGPGSFSGLRVGISNILGLSRALGCGLFPVSVFDALSQVSRETVDLYIGVQHQKNEVLYVEYNIGQSHNPSKIETSEFVSQFVNNKDCIVDVKLYKTIYEKYDINSDSKLVRASDNVSVSAFNFYWSNKEIKKENLNKPLIFYFSS